MEPIGFEALEDPGEAVEVRPFHRTATEPLRAEEQADHLGGGDRDDGEVVGPQAQRRDAEEEGEGDRADEMSGSAQNGQS